MITLEKAKKAVAAAEAKARELGIAVTVAVVDEHGTPVMLSRMDGALLISPRFAMKKAFTSALLKMASDQPAAYAGEGKPYFTIDTGFGGDIILVAGGVPVSVDGGVIGAVGVGGSADVSQDKECAQAAVDAIGA